VAADRQLLEWRERQWLAAYAMLSAESRGRQYPEAEDLHRTAFRRDHDRVIHSAAFRRLEYKTQVFANHEGDYYRTRLTHSIEVAQVAVSIARVLRLNEDLVEVLCLTHDIGHPPFGHAGQEVLRELMRDHGGFEHNMQGLRIVDLLERRYPEFPGLNLTWEVRESINKHRQPYDQPDLQIELDPESAPLLEAQLADTADELTYLAHDIDDGLTAGILKGADLEQSSLWAAVRDTVLRRMPPANEEVRKYQIVRELINRQVLDVIQESAHRLQAQGIDSVAAVRRCRVALISCSAEMARLRSSLRHVLWNKLYRHERVMQMAGRAQAVIRGLFCAYLEDTCRLPATTRSRIARGEQPERVVCDYIAGMTDRYCLEAYRRLLDPRMQI
jgi:dGTPase